MAKIHVLLKKEELDAERLQGKVVIVLDILFATTSIVAVLAHGASEVQGFLFSPPLPPAALASLLHSEAAKNQVDRQKAS